MISSLTCPKCGGPRDAKALYCPFCGIIFARHQADGAAPASAPPRRATEDVPREFNPYQAPAAPVRDVATALRPRDQIVLARRLTRLAAQFLDMIIYFVALLGAGFLAGVLVGVVSPAGEEPTEELMMSLMMVLLIVILTVFLINLYFLSREGQTLGKMALKIRIVRSDGEKAGLGRILLLRMMAPGFLGGIPYVGLLFALLNILFIFGEERRCIHDYFADTIVVVA